MSRKKKSPPDPFADWREIQDHQYDPGYWTGGRVHPLYRRGKRPNKYGWVLVILGMFVIMNACASLGHGGWQTTTAMLAIAVSIVCIFAGVRLAVPAKKQ
jgi:hypothetical protein